MQPTAKNLTTINCTSYQSHQIRLPFQLNFSRQTFPSSASKISKKEFATWVVGAGIRELLEHYGHFLDYIHNYSLFVLKVRGKLGELEPQKEQETFTRRLGIPDKLSTLEKRFGISFDVVPENVSAVR